MSTRTHSRAAALVAAACTALAACSGNARFSIQGAPATSTRHAVAYSFQPVASGAAGTVVWSLDTAPAGMTVSATTGLVAWTPAYADLGTHPVALRATDADGNTALRQWNLRVHQGLDLGVTLSPRGHTGSTTNADYAAHLDPGNGLGPLRAFHCRWRDFATADGQVPELAQFAATTAATYGFVLAIGFGWTDDAGTPDLTSDSDPATNSWANVETRAEFLQMVVAFATANKPAYLFLGNETNSYYVTHSAPEWSAWISEFEACYDAIKAVSPSTVVFTTFQLEKMKGGGATNGWSYAAHWGLIADHAASGKIDAIGFTSYPYFDYATPSAIPAGYYDEIAAHWTGAVVFTEIGWPATARAPYPGSETDQSDFVDTFFARTDDLPTSYVAWLFAHDWDQDASLPAFTAMGLRSNDGTTVRAADATWRSAVALRQQ